MLFLILAIALMTLGFVVYAVGKNTKRRWMKLLGILTAIVGFLIFAAVVIGFLFPGVLAIF